MFVIGNGICFPPTNLGTIIDVDKAADRMSRTSIYIISAIDEKNTFVNKKWANKQSSGNCK